MPSSADDDSSLTPTLRHAATSVLRAAGAAASRPVIILVDGRSGAGKSTFASMLAQVFEGAVVVGLDDLYPGWDGLRAGAETALAGILQPVREGRAGRWQTWDWTRNELSGVWRSVRPTTVLIVEGAGVLTPASAALADVTVWLDAPAATRRRRALQRDGETFRPHWEQWAQQEEDHLRAHDPRSLARVVVDLP